MSGSRVKELQHEHKRVGLRIIQFRSLLRHWSQSRNSETLRPRAHHKLYPKPYIPKPHKPLKSNPKKSTQELTKAAVPQPADPLGFDGFVGAGLCTENPGSTAMGLEIIITEHGSLQYSSIKANKINKP